MIEAWSRFGISNARQWRARSRRRAGCPSHVPGPRRPRSEAEKVDRAVSDEGNTHAMIARANWVFRRRPSAIHARGSACLFDESSPGDTTGMRSRGSQQGHARDGVLSAFRFLKGDLAQGGASAGEFSPRSHLIPLSELLVKGRRTSRAHLKGRLIAAGIKENRCEICGISTWLGQPLSAQLHHGTATELDNRLENIQLLCANCHSQTETYGGRNGHQKADRHLRLVDAERGEEAA